MDKKAYGFEILNPKAVDEMATFEARFTMGLKKFCELKKSEYQISDRRKILRIAT